MRGIKVGFIFVYFKSCKNWLFSIFYNITCSTNEDLNKLYLNYSSIGKFVYVLRNIIG